MHKMGQSEKKKARLDAAGYGLYDPSRNYRVTNMLTLQEVQTVDMMMRKPGRKNVHRHNCLA